MYLWRREILYTEDNLKRNQDYVETEHWQYSGGEILSYSCVFFGLTM